ncbi:hypothetical protein ACTFIT_004087 [Dictyostelium discoideum]
MYRFKIPTCCCENCKLEEGSHSDRIIIPTQLPNELEGYLTFEQYKLLATECRNILNRSDMAYKIGIGSVLLGTLLSLIFIWVRKSIIGLILLSATIVTIISIGIIASYLIIKLTQSLLDKKINQFNIDFNSTSKGFRIEKNTKQYSSSLNEDNETEVSKLTFIYIIYNIEKQDVQPQTVIEFKTDEINEMITHKFQIENNDDSVNNNINEKNDFIINIPKDGNCDGIILLTNNGLKQSRGLDKISLIKQH